MRASVRRLAGVGQLTGDWHAHAVQVEYDPDTVTIEEIQAALSTFGYDSTVIAAV